MSEVFKRKPKSHLWLSRPLAVALLRFFTLIFFHFGKTSFSFLNDISIQNTVIESSTWIEQRAKEVDRLKKVFNQSKKLLSVFWCFSLIFNESMKSEPHFGSWQKRLKTPVLEQVMISHHYGTMYQVANKLNQ